MGQLASLVDASSTTSHPDLPYPALSTSPISQADLVAFVAGIVVLQLNVAEHNLVPSAFSSAEAALVAYVQGVLRRLDPNRAPAKRKTFTMVIAELGGEPLGEQGGELAALFPAAWRLGDKAAKEDVVRLRKGRPLLGLAAAIVRTKCHDT